MQGVRVGWAIVVALGAGCMAPTPQHAQRWPKHRQRGDARFDELEKKVAVLEANAALMRRRIAQLEQLVQNGAPAPQPKGADAPSPPALSPPAPSP